MEVQELLKLPRGVPAGDFVFSTPDLQVVHEADNSLRSKKTNLVNRTFTSRSRSQQMMEDNDVSMLDYIMTKEFT